MSRPQACRECGGRYRWHSTGNVAEMACRRCGHVLMRRRLVQPGTTLTPTPPPRPRFGWWPWRGSRG